MVHANLGLPTPGTLTELPFDVGTVCFPLLMANPAAIWTNISNPAIGTSRGFDGSPIPDPARAPTIFLLLYGGDPAQLPAGTQVTFQGVILDPGSSSPNQASTTNTVILSVN